MFYFLKLSLVPSLDTQKAPLREVQNFLCWESGGDAGPEFLCWYQEEAGPFLTASVFFAQRDVKLSSEKGAVGWVVTEPPRRVSARGCGE